MDHPSSLTKDQGVRAYKFCGLDAVVSPISLSYLYNMGYDDLDRFYGFDELFLDERFEDTVDNRLVKLSFCF